jgi:PKD repeat protein
MLVLFSASGCSEPYGPSPSASNAAVVTIHPNLSQARTEGFHLIVGHPPFSVDFWGEVEGAGESPSYAWDFDGDGFSDSEARDPEPFVYTEPGEYQVTLSVTGPDGRRALARQRIVVVGEPDWPEWRYGVAEHLNRAHGLYASDAEVEEAARLISEAGIDAVRLDLSWSAVQPENEDEYDWKDYDYLVGVGEKYGFDLLPIIDYSTTWAATGATQDERGQAHVPPVPEKYAWFAYKAADRYKDDIPAWEVWNEPNHSGFWYPEPDPALYAEVLSNAYLAIKYADPRAPVVLGGLASAGNGTMPPEQFLQGVYDAGGGDSFDAVGRHPYASGLLDVYTVNRQLEDLRTVMLDNGDGDKPVWLTEFGNSAVPFAAVTDQTQATWLVQSLDEFGSLDYVPVVFWYNFREKGTDPNAYEHNFGLVESDWTIKPAYEAYADYIADEPLGRGPPGDGRWYGASGEPD